MTPAASWPNTSDQIERVAYATATISRKATIWLVSSIRISARWSRLRSATAPLVDMNPDTTTDSDDTASTQGRTGAP